MTERWLPVVGFETYYEVSDRGRVRRIKQTKGTRCGVLKPWPDAVGRLKVALSVDQVKQAKTIARLVAIAFLGDSPLEVNHIDGNFTNNKLDNLEYNTRKENAAHASRMGLMAHGTRIPWSKLNDAKVREIRQQYAEGYPQDWLSVRYGVHQSVISSVVTGKTWRHVQ